MFAWDPARRRVKMRVRGEEEEPGEGRGQMSRSLEYPLLFLLPSFPARLLFLANGDIAGVGSSPKKKEARVGG